jgi:hypothetical protein
VVIDTGGRISVASGATLEITAEEITGGGADVSDAL